MASDHDEAMRQSKFLTGAIAVLANEVELQTAQASEDLAFRRAGLATREDLSAMESRLGTLIMNGIADANVAAVTRALEISSGALAAAVARNLPPKE